MVTVRCIGGIFEQPIVKTRRSYAVTSKPNEMAVRLYLFCLLFFPALLVAQDRVTLSGYVREAESGETLIGANVFVKSNPVKGTSTNAYGFYSLSLEPGDYTIVYSYLGYAEQERQVSLTENATVSIDMSEGVALNEVVVTAEEADENVKETQMGTVEVGIDKIKKLPALFGEVDVLKTLQLLPGVLSSGEGTSGFYVRGGAPTRTWCCWTKPWSTTVGTCSASLVYLTPMPSKIPP